MVIKKSNLQKTESLKPPSKIIESDGDYWDYFFDESELTYFDIINKDLNLLIVLVFLESFNKKKDRYSLESFIKGKYWHKEDILEEVIEHDDEVFDINNLLLKQIIFIFEYLGLGIVKEVGVESLEDLIEYAISQIAKSNNTSKEDIENNKYLLEQLYETKFKQEQARHEKLKELVDAGNDKEYAKASKGYKGFFSNKNGICEDFLECATWDFPEYVDLRVDYLPEGFAKLKKNIDDYFNNFINDKYLEYIPENQPKRLYFSEQISNFCKYINKFDLVGNVIKVYFDILEQDKFEAVKILHFLERNKLIEINWSDANSWKVKFNKLPITPQNLLNPKSEQKEPEKKKLKADLSFSESLKTLKVDNIEIKISSPDQMSVLRTIFMEGEDKWRECFYDEVSGVHDIAVAKFDDKKFYNASYNLNRKIATKTSYKKILLTSRHSVKLNPEQVKT